MKKFLAVVLVLAVLIAAITLFLKRDDIFPTPITTTDLSDKSTSDLLTLQNEVKAELSRRAEAHDGVSSWSDILMGQYLPNPNDVFKKKVTGFFDLASNREDDFGDRFKNSSNESFKLYCDACIAWGFTNVESYNAVSFEARDSENRELSMVYYNSVGEVSVSLRAGEK